MKDDKPFIFSQVYNKGEQRRKFPRIPVEIRGTFIYKDVNTEFVEKCLITSLSIGGLGFETSAVLLKDDIITVSFPLENKIIKEDAKITRVQGKEAGCKFISPNPENTALIQNYIHNKLFKK